MRNEIQKREVVPDASWHHYGVTFGAYVLSAELSSKEQLGDSIVLVDACLGLSAPVAKPKRTSGRI